MPEWATLLIGVFFSTIHRPTMIEGLITERITDAIARSYYEQGDGVLLEFKLDTKTR